MAEAFNPQGTTKYLWVETIASPAAPTVAELTAGVDLSDAILSDGVAGFGREPSEVDATTISATGQQTVPGLPTTTSGSFTLRRANTDDADGYTLFNTLLGDVNTEGYVVMALDGTTAADSVVDVWPSTIASVNPNPMVGGQAARYTVAFTHSDDPSLNVKVVA